MTFDFPKDFIFGTASSCYQVEGSAYADGKTENIWDYACRVYPEKFKNKTEPTSGFYKHFREDIAQMKEQGLRSFRMSLSWTRIIPKIDGKVNKAGIDFYNEVIDCLLENGIEPFVDIFHWDLPLYLLEIGGFTNREIIRHFTHFAGVCFENFGDRVKFWSTMNEPSVFCIAPYTAGRTWPPFEDSIEKRAIATHNALLCHFSAVRLYREMKLPGKIGAVIAFVPVYPKNPGDEKDIFATKLRIQQGSGIWLYPMYFGEYPKELTEECSAYFDYMPKNYKEELKEAFSPVDIIGLNYYFPAFTTYSEDSIFKSTDVENYYVQEGQRFSLYPAGLYDSMIFCNEEYKQPEIYITENGLGMLDDGNKDAMIHDKERISYLREHLRMLSRAIKAGVNVKGYYYWSNFDSFENAAGYSYRFGLNYVDFETGERTRKDSWYYYQRVIKDCCVD